MNHMTRNKPQKNHDEICGDLLTMAERELAAFSRAVSESYGKKQAEISAEDWLQELTATHDLPKSVGEWRGITIKASVRLPRDIHNCETRQSVPLPILKSNSEAREHATMASLES